MDLVYRRRLEGNIAKYSWYKIFTKRVYLPLITIQLVNVGQVTLEELAVIVVVSSIAQAVLQMPAGYLADKIGNRRSVVLGACIAAPSPLLYVFMPNFEGGLIASVLFFGGYAFQSGAIEAFMHDTLVALGRAKDYSKVMGRAQTYGLVGNIILVALVPMTYAIHPSIPFILGFFSLLAMLWLTTSFEYPRSVHTEAVAKNPVGALTSVVTTQNVALFIFSGFLAGVSNKGLEFRELLFQHVGIVVSLFGIILAASSLLGAVMGWYIHILDRLKPMLFYLLDLTLLAGCLVLAGATSNPLLAVVALTIFAAYSRVRLIVFQAKMLHEIKHVYKATLISALSLFIVLGDVIAISLLTKFVTGVGYLQGHVLFGLSIFGIGIFLWSLMVLEARYRRAREG